MSKRKTVFRLFFLLLFLVMAVFFLAQADFLHRLVYPFHYRDIVIEESHKNELDPLLVAAVIWTESGFREEAESAKGAKGLMQIMPGTAFWVAEKKDWHEFSIEKLCKPEVNIAIGTWYLGNLLQSFNGNRYVALAAYNGGRGRVYRWLQEGVWDGTPEDVENIPYPETRSFVKKVERTYERYRQIYGQEEHYSNWEGNSCT